MTHVLMKTARVISNWITPPQIEHSMFEKLLQAHQKSLNMK